MYTHIWFFFSVIPGTGNVPKETRRSNMIGKQPPLQRFASMQDYLPDLDYAVHTMVCLIAANFCRLPLFNLTYRPVHRDTSSHNLYPTKRRISFPSTVPIHSVESAVYREILLVQKLPFLPRYTPTSDGWAKIHGGKASAGQSKRKRDYASPRHHRGNGGWKIRNGVDNYATTIIGERNYDYAPPHAVAANFLASPLLRRASALPLRAASYTREG